MILSIVLLIHFGYYSNKRLLEKCLLAVCLKALALEAWPVGLKILGLTTSPPHSFQLVVAAVGIATYSGPEF